jgi:ribosomal protein S18 acetylase RimI-like enzyme
MMMNDVIFRSATIDDVPFLVDTIIEAEKSGTEILTYCTIFGLSEEEARKYIAEMLLEEIDGCELSISSFLLAEKNGQIAASVGAWVEGTEGIPSTILKGNLLNYTLPKKCIEHALALNTVVRELHIEYIAKTIQIGLVYVAAAFRGQNFVSLLIDEQVKRLRINHPEISEIYVQVFGNNIPAIRAYEKSNFEVQLVKESLNKEVIKYMPSDKKILMKRVVTTF